jgi:hypothetical protein
MQPSLLIARTYDVTIFCARLSSSESNGPALIFDAVSQPILLSHQLRSKMFQPLSMSTTAQPSVSVPRKKKGNANMAPVRSLYVQDVVARHVQEPLPGIVHFVSASVASGSPAQHCIRVHGCSSPRILSNIISDCAIELPRALG